MKVELLYFDGCPAYETAEKTLKEVLANLGIEADITLVAVNTDEEASKLRFPGSPTLRIEGRDLFPAPEWEDWRLGCRVYVTPQGLRGSPTAEMLRRALKKRYYADRGISIATPSENNACRKPTFREEPFYR